MNSREQIAREVKGNWVRPMSKKPQSKRSFHRAEVVIKAREP